MRWLKRIGYALAVVAVLVLIAVGVVYAVSESRLRRVYAVPPETIAVSDDSATLAHGEHVATAVAGCTDCHGDR